MTSASNPQLVLGCDVGKHEIVVFSHPSGELRTLPNCRDDLETVLSKTEPGTLIVCEATGGHEASLLAAATSAGLPIHRADPSKASAFARSLRRHGKTDAIDARALARYGVERGAELPLWQPQSLVRTELTKLVRLRDQFVQQCSDSKRRAGAPGEGCYQKHLQDHVIWLRERIALIEAEIEALIASDPALQETADVIESIPGCGPVVAMTLVALMPELGYRNRREVASLAGLAPHPYQSGGYDGKRRARGGRPELKRILSIAALSARRYNPDIQPFSKRLLDTGKPKPVVNLAAARKLLTIINARVRDHRLNTQPKLC